MRGHYNTQRAMIPAAEARARILSQIGAPTPVETSPVARALGRVLARDLVAPFDVPPADNSAVDGYAVRGGAPPGNAPLRVVRDLPAGQVFAGEIGPGEALHIMTGAPMPRGADTVVPQELACREGHAVRLGPVPRGANVRARGEDVRAGEPVLRRGAVLRPSHLGLAASLGLDAVPVHARPRVAVLSTGDEVAAPGRPRAPGQIYDANRYSLAGLVEAEGGQALDLGIVPDVRDALARRLSEAAAQADVVITSGGVSVGAYDLVKAVLGDLGRIDFWQVAVQPGRPLAFGTLVGRHFFGLPGNPVASMLTFLLFVRPALRRLSGRADLDPLRFHAVAAEPIRKKTGRLEVKRGVLRPVAAGWEVRTTGPQGSGILSSMAAADCLIFLPEDAGDVAPGDRVTVEPL
jgi:molybdopterin molybdotransferase